MHFVSDSDPDRNISKVVNTPYPFCPITSLANCPIDLNILHKWLEGYPNRDDAQLIMDGFQSGFRLPYEGPREFRWAKNHREATAQPEIVQEKLLDEIS